MENVLDGPVVPRVLHTPYSVQRLGSLDSLEPQIHHVPINRGTFEGQFTYISKMNLKCLFPFVSTDHQGLSVCPSGY